MIVSANGLFGLSPDADPRQLAMLAINPPTAALLLSEYVKLKTGDWVVQNSANSGVGRWVIAFAKTRGLSLLSDKTNAVGMREYVVAYGNARVTEGGAVKLLQSLAPIYLGPGAEYPPPAMRNIAGYVTRITAARFSGIGPWAEKGAE